MPNDVRLKRLQKLALQRASQVVLYELHDPRLELVTLSRVEITNDLAHAKVYWSTLAEEKSRSKIAHALNDARGTVQRAIAESFQTRRAPRITFIFDESIAGAIRMGNILDQLTEERGPEPDSESDSESGDESEVGAADESESDSKAAADSDGEEPRASTDATELPR